MKIRSLQQVCHDLHKVSLIRELSGLLSAGQQCFLVGGALRDTFLGRACNDFDFVTPFDPTCLAQKLARHLSGTWFFLDEKRRQSRIVVSRCDGQLLCDFGTLRSMSLLKICPCAILQLMRPRCVSVPISNQMTFMTP